MGRQEQREGDKIRDSKKIDQPDNNCGGVNAYQKAKDAQVSGLSEGEDDVAIHRDKEYMIIS